MPTDPMSRVFTDIRAERAYQDEKWGGAEEDDLRNGRHDWIDHIGRYLLNAQREALRNTPAYRRQLVKVAALAVAAIEQVDRSRVIEPAA